MKKTLLVILSSCFLLLANSCKKDNVDSNGLPPATQSGANTLGFLLNGKPWTPAGYNGGSPNLTVNVDLGYKNGVFGISAYRQSNYTEPIYFGIGISDSLNFLTIPITLNLDTNSLFRIYFSDSSCTYYSTDTSMQEKGRFTITKLDKTAGIISGIFNATFYEPGCDSFKITNGRFDMKF